MIDAHTRQVLGNRDLNNYGINGTVQVRGPAGDTVGVRAVVHGSSTSPVNSAQPQAPAQSLVNQFKPGRWSQEEHERFLRGFELYGHKWRKVRDVVGTRTVTQVRTHAQKFFVKLKKQSTMEKPTITTPHKSPRAMLPSITNKEFLKAQKMGGNWQSKVQFDFLMKRENNRRFSKFESLLKAAEKVERGDGLPLEAPFRSC